MNTPKFVVYKEGVWWHFDLKAANGKVVYSSKQYAKPQFALDAIKVLTNLIKSDPPIVKDYNGRK